MASSIRTCWTDRSSCVAVVVDISQFYDEISYLID